MFWANSKMRKIVDCDIQNTYFWGFENDSAAYIDPTNNLALYIPVVPHKAVAEVSKIGNL